MRTFAHSSGAMRGRFSGAAVPVLHVNRHVQIKRRADGFHKLYDWLAGFDFLIVKSDHGEPLVIARLEGVKIAVAAEGRNIKQ